MSSEERGAFSHVVLISGDSDLDISTLHRLAGPRLSTGSLVLIQHALEKRVLLQMGRLLTLGALVANRSLATFIMTELTASAGGNVRVPLQPSHRWSNRARPAPQG